MSIVELKQQISRLDRNGREEVFAYLVRLKHETPMWRQMAARRLRSMRKGKGVTVVELEARIAAR